MMNALKTWVVANILMNVGKISHKEAIKKANIK